MDLGAPDEFPTLHFFSFRISNFIIHFSALALHNNVSGCFDLRRALCLLSSCLWVPAVPEFYVLFSLVFVLLFYCFFDSIVHRGAPRSHFLCACPALIGGCVWAWVGRVPSILILIPHPKATPHS